MACLTVALAGLALVQRPRPLYVAADRRPAMGTGAYVVAWVPEAEQAGRAVAEAFRELERVERVMSAYDRSSQISRVNREAAEHPVKVSGELFDLLQTAIGASRASGGAFDITVGPLVELWRQAGRRERLPDPDELEAALARVGWPLVHLEAAEGTVRLARSGMRLDLGGIAKGYGVDRALAVLRRRGAWAGLVEVGGDLAVFGSPPGKAGWTVGVQDPFGPGLTATLVLAQGAVATSGNYFRFVTIGGRRYSHIIDPRTGRPAEAAPSVTVVAPTAVQADWLATALSVLGPPGLERLVESQANAEALLILGPDRPGSGVRRAASRGFGRLAPR